MAYTPARFYIGQPGTAETTLYTPTNSSALVKQVIVTNTTGTAATLTLSFVPYGKVADMVNRIMVAVSFGANSITLFNMTQVLAAGDFISGQQGTAAALTVTISGVTY